VNLEPVHLTLEPIAAIDAAIPPSIRLLNLALVDIGAGTSDIAVTKEGSITGYGMVPMAGDEITEPIVENLLVEFHEAEKIKRQLCTAGEITYTDILGATGTVTRDEVLRFINPVLDELADAISANILELNGGVPPKSVFCIGGGSQVPTLTQKLAKRLQLDDRRVVIRDRGSLRNLNCVDNNLSGPDGVTVVGIATVALTRLGYEFMKVTINGSEYKFFNTQNMNVSQALGLAKFNPRQLICQNGANLKFWLNGKEKIVYGQLGQPARILVNNREANLQTPVRDGDEILVIKAVDGRDASATVADFLPQKTEWQFKLNGKTVVWKVRCIVNGEKAEATTPLRSGDKLDITAQPTVGEIARLHGIDTTACTILVNGRKAQPGDVVAEGDVLETRAEKGPEAPVIHLTVNGKRVSLPGSKALLVDVFNYIAVDTTKPKGTLVMKLNGAPAQFTDPIRDGDQVEIYWQEIKV